MFGYGSPTVTVDTAVAKHFEVLLGSSARGIGVVKCVFHADAFDRTLRNAVYHERLGKAHNVEYCRCYVNDMVPLRADLALSLDAVRPVENDAVARAAIV